MISVDTWSNFHNKYCSEDYKRSLKAQQVINDKRMIGKFVKKFSQRSLKIDSMEEKQDMNIISFKKIHRHQNHYHHRYWT
jgi:hypothetical protein